MGNLGVDESRLIEVWRSILKSANKADGRVAKLASDTVKALGGVSEFSIFMGRRLRLESATIGLYRRMASAFDILPDLGAWSIMGWELVSRFVQIEGDKDRTICLDIMRRKAVKTGAVPRQEGAETIKEFLPKIEAGVGIDGVRRVHPAHKFDVLASWARKVLEKHPRLLRDMPRDVKEYLNLEHSLKATG